MLFSLRRVPRRNDVFAVWLKESRIHAPYLGGYVVNRKLHGWYWTTQTPLRAVRSADLSEIPFHDEQTAASKLADFIAFKLRCDRRRYAQD
jgi:hypothetical protein